MSWKPLILWIALSAVCVRVYGQELINVPGDYINSGAVIEEGYYDYFYDQGPEPVGGDYTPVDYQESIEYTSTPSNEGTDAGSPGNSITTPSNESVPETGIALPPVETTPAAAVDAMAPSPAPAGYPQNSSSLTLSELIQSTCNNISDALQGKDFSTLSELIASNGKVVVGEVPTTGVIVVSAPTNDAFQNLLLELGMTQDQLEQDNDLVTDVLKVHLSVAQNLDATMAGTLGGADINFMKVNTTEALTLKQVLADPVQASVDLNSGSKSVVRGVIDCSSEGNVAVVIDKVLLPQKVLDDLIAPSQSPSPANSNENTNDVGSPSGATRKMILSSLGIGTVVISAFTLLLQ